MKKKVKPTKYAPKNDIKPKKGNKLTARYKKMIREKGVWKFILYICMVGLIVIASAALAFALFIIITAPDFDKDKLYNKEVTVIYDKDGNELAKIGSENRILVTYDDLPQVLVDAIIATEDSRFFQHNGLDIARFLKASAKQMMGSNEGGASTLSMQIIKKTYTSTEAHGIKGIIRKFTDIYMSVFKLENSYTKEEIFEFYVNSQWFAHDGNINYNGIYGVEQASQTFFGKSVSDISLAEASLLAGMFQNPNLYNPIRNPEGCRNRQKIVLKLMVNHGYITEEEQDAVLAIPVESLLVQRSETAATNNNQDVIDLVIDMVAEETGQNPYNTAMQIYTTIDPNIQQVVNNMENNAYYKFRTYDADGNLTDNHVNYSQESTVITSVENGAIVGLSGGIDYSAKGLNRSTVRRQPGSTAKPFFDYGPYIEYLNGSSGSYFFDEPYTYSNGTTIMDADRGYQGMITIREALVGSRNITALQAFQAVMKEDPNLIPDYVHSFGIDYGSALYESASIGGFDGISPIEMSGAYGAYARGGYYIKPYIFSKIIYADGTTYEHKADKVKVCSEETAFMITSSLISAVEQGWSGSIRINGTQVAGKTGTTTIDDKALTKLGVPEGTIPDSWSVSYNPDYVIALWYGYDTITKDHYMGTNEGWTARSNIMAGLAKDIYSQNRTFSTPSGIIQVEVEKKTVPLQLPSANTPADMRMTEYFKEGTEPTEVSPRYQSLPSPSNGKATVTGNKVTLTWDKIETPENLDNNKLSKMFDENYGKFASKYYETRIAENGTQLGSIVYDIYVLDETGNQKLLKTVSDNKFTTTITKDTTFYVKANYSKLRSGESSGIKIVAEHHGIFPPIIDDDDDKKEDEKPIEEPPVEEPSLD